MGGGTVEAGLDPRWLRAAAEREPIHHAYALWDQEHAPDRVEFRTLREDGEPTAYLLIWRGRPEYPVVHWVGSARDPAPLLEALPERPLIAVVPAALEPEVARWRGPVVSRPVLLMAGHRPVDPQELAPGSGRRLTRADLPALRRLAEEHPDDLTYAYAAADPETTPIFGVVERGRLLAVARITATTPRAWIIGGVFTLPAERGRGHGTAATRAAVAAALSVGVRPGLFVEEANRPARRIYDRLGFVALERRAWVDARGGPATPNAS